LAGNQSLYSDTASITIDTEAGSESFSITEVTAIASNNTVTVTWTTDELASSQLEYGLTASYGSSTTEADTSTRVTAHTVQVTTLSKCKTYYYRVRSKNSSEIEVIGENKSFTTTGCSSSSSKKSSSGSSKSKSSKSNKSTTTGPITLTKINSVNISPQVNDASAMWNNYYSSSSKPWFYGSGEKSGTKVTVYTWSNIKLCEGVVSGGVWGCVPDNDMEIKTHRIDIRYGSKLLPAFNLKIGGSSVPKSAPVAQNSKPATSKPNVTLAVPAIKKEETVFGKLLIKQVKGESDNRDLNTEKFDDAKRIIGFLIVVNILALVTSIIIFSIIKRGSKKQ
jgi:hypothetical protein